MERHPDQYADYLRKELGARLKPGAIIAVHAPPRAGKTRGTIEWALGTGRRVVFVGPSWGNPSAPDSGALASAMRYLPTETPVVPLAGKAKICSERRGAVDADTGSEEAAWANSRRQRIASREHCCGLPGSTIVRDVASIAGRPDCPPPPSRGKVSFPDGSSAGFHVPGPRGMPDCLACPVEVNMARAWRAAPGTFTFTVPSKLRELVDALSDVNEQYGHHRALASFADGLILVVDEAHKEASMFGIENEVRFRLADIPGLPPVPRILESVFRTLQPTGHAPIKPIPGAPAIGGLFAVYPEVPIASWMVDALQVPAVGRAWGTGPHTSPLQLLQRALRELCTSLIPVLQLAPRDEEEAAPRPAGAYADAIHSASQLKPRENAPTIFSDFEGTWLWQHLHAHLDKIPENDLSADQREWDGLLRVLESAPKGHLWAEYRQERIPDAPMKFLWLSVLDRYSLSGGHDPTFGRYDEPRGMPTVRWGPVSRLAKYGGTVVLLSATPLPVAALSARLGGRPVDVVAYPPEFAKPRVVVALEPASQPAKGTAAGLPMASSEGRLRREAGGAWTFTGPTKKQLAGILSAVQGMHLVARNRDEESAAHAWAKELRTDGRRVTIHLFRGRTSVGVAWAANWPIVFLGPPFGPWKLPLADRGIVLATLGPQDDLTRASRAAWQEDAFQEAWQMACRTATVARGDEDATPARVIVLGAGKLSPLFIDAGRAWGIDVVEALAVSTTQGPGKNDLYLRGRLQVESMGLTPQGLSTNAHALLDAVASGLVPAIFRAADLRRPPLGWSVGRASAVLTELVRAGRIERVEAPGKGQAFAVVSTK